MIPAQHSQEEPSPALSSSSSTTAAAATTTPPPVPSTTQSDNVRLNTLKHGDLESEHPINNNVIPLRKTEVWAW
ncbi:hypothetical protein BG004_004011, partial [Podila humilis]